MEQQVAAQQTSDEELVYMDLDLAVDCEKEFTTAEEDYPESEDGDGEE